MASKKAIAFHEAGHAVMAVRCRVGLTAVSIVPADDIKGVLKIKNQKSFSRTVYDTRGMVGRIHQRIMVALGGGVAEQLYSKLKTCPSGNTHDVNAAIVLAGRLSEDEEAYALVNYLAIRTRNILQEPATWKGVEALAKELLAKKKMAGQQARRIIKDAEKAYYEET